MCTVSWVNMTDMNAVHNIFKYLVVNILRHVGLYFLRRTCYHNLLFVSLYKFNDLWYKFVCINFLAFDINFMANITFSATPLHSSIIVIQTHCHCLFYVTLLLLPILVSLPAKNQHQGQWLSQKAQFKIPHGSCLQARLQCYMRLGYATVWQVVGLICWDNSAASVV